MAAEAGVSRARLSTWKNRYDQYGEAGCETPQASRSPAAPTRTPPDVFERTERLRWDNRWSTGGQQVVNRWSARATVLELANGACGSANAPWLVAGAPGRSTAAGSSTRRIHQPAPALEAYVVVRPGTTGATEPAPEPQRWVTQVWPRREWRRSCGASRR
ncbi:hypothetical protein OG622_04060 [Streptomyces sp. NBC_01314]|nr:hypothetical protein OG622_04060 [Streptomyces sp. NBC_01314]